MVFLRLTVLFLIFTIVDAEKDDNLLCPGMVMSVNPKAPCYLLITKPENYSSAHANCIIHGGQLVKAKNSFVNSFIQKTVTFLMTQTKKIWLGANNLEVIWSWIDGERFSYTNWGQGYPDEHNHCLAMEIDDGSWESTGCFALLPYICEMGIP